MRITVSVKTALLIIVSLCLFCGCADYCSDVLPPLYQVREAVRKRMLKLQSDELLARVANEHYAPHSAGEVLSLASGYQSGMWNVGNDPALQSLENAIAYALVVLSSHPTVTAEKLSRASLDYGTALRILKIQTGSGDSVINSTAELVMMTGWTNRKVRKFAAFPLPDLKIEIFPIYPEAERLLNEKGRSAAFQTAAELYRIPSDSALRKAEQLRRAILNRYLIQTKSPGAKITPELRVAYWRGQIFASLMPPL